MSRYLATVILATVAVAAMIPRLTYAARDNKAEGTLTVLPDGTHVLTLNVRIPGMGHSLVYVEYQPVAVDDIPFELVDEPGPDTEFGLGVGFVRAANGDVRTAVVVVRDDPGQPLQLDFSWTDSITLADGTVVSGTPPFPPQFPSALSIGVSPDESGTITGTTSWTKKIIILQ